MIELIASVAPTELECRIISSFAELEGLSTDWERLHNSGARPEVFQSFAWAKAWWQSLRRDSQLCTPVVKYRGTVVAILPLVLIDRQLRFLAFSVADYNHILAEPAFARAAFIRCLTVLRESDFGWAALHLENVPASSILAQCIENLPAEWKKWTTQLHSDPCPTLLLGIGKQATLESLLNKEKLRKTVRQLAKRGELKFRHFEDRADIAKNLPTFMRQHICRSAIAGRPSGFLNKDYVDFYTRITELLDVRQELRFSVLELDGRPIAYHFGAAIAGKYLFYKPTFDVDLWDLSPGQALLWHLFEYLKLTNVDEFDFGLGGESYKYRFSNKINTNVNYCLRRPGPSALVRQVIQSAQDTVKQWIRGNPTLSASVLRLLEAHVRLRTDIRCLGVFRVLVAMCKKSLFGRTVNVVVKVGNDGYAEISPRAAVQEITLSTLAEIAGTSSSICLTDASLLRARDLIRAGAKAWLAAVNNVPTLVMWTAVSSEMTAMTLRVPLPSEALQVQEVWPLDQKPDGFLAALHEISAIHKAKGLDTFAICCIDRLPPLHELHSAGLVAYCKIVCDSILGKQHTHLIDLQSHAVRRGCSPE